MIGHTLGGFTMMQIGQFKFGIPTAAYQELRRTTEYKWPAQERMSRHEALQYTGPGPDTVTLTGVVFPEFRGGTGQIESLRALASEGRPQLMVSGTGQILGQYVIERIDETQGVFAAAGVPRRQEFTLQLRRYER